MGQQRKKRVSKVQLPEEIIVEILSRLPVKVLLRFKCVCKLWKSLISNPNFILSTTGRERAIAGCYTYCDDINWVRRVGLYSVDDELSVVKLPNPVGEVPYSFVGFQLLGTCNGLVLFCADRRMYLWNPLTRCCRQLSQLNDLVNRFQRRAPCGIASGMWFDKYSDDYKILVVNTPRAGIGGDTGLDKFVCVASLKKRENWMDISFPYQLPHRADITATSIPGVLLRGHLHWIVMREIGAAQLIIYFDEGINQFRELPMPNEPVLYDGGTGYYFGLALLNGCLCMSGGLPGHNNVFVMREYGVRHSWTKLCTISGVLVPLHTRVSSKTVLVSDFRSLFALDIEKMNFIMRIKGQPVCLKDPPLKRTHNLRDRKTYNLRKRVGSTFESDGLFEPVDLLIVSGPLIYVETLASVDLV